LENILGGALDGILFTTTMLSAGLVFGPDFVVGFGLGLFGCAKLSISRGREGVGMFGLAGGPGRIQLKIKPTQPKTVTTFSSFE